MTCTFGIELSGRQSSSMTGDWTFNYFPQSEFDTRFVQPQFDDSKWQAVAIPHTWSTYETTGEVHPFIYTPSERDDTYWWYGWGYYRKTFRLDPSLKNKRITVEFDGVQKYSRIYLNGKFIGDHKGGFTSFYFDLTDEINWKNENVLAVLVSNRRNDEHQIPPMTAGNWNVYGGIYRNVRMVVKNNIHFPYQGSYKHEGGTFITTSGVSQHAATVHIKTYVQNSSSKDENAVLKTTVISPENKKFTLTALKKVSAGDMACFEQDNKILDPILWSPDSPSLYKVVSTLTVNDQIVDEIKSPLGIRWFRWDYDTNDLYVNGSKINIKGINRHQEYPWLGDAIPKWISRMDMVDIKQNLGHNFMRLAHYPNDAYLYHLADSLGIIMVEEAPNIKSIDFNEKVQEQNVREMIRRDRNHPSIFFWSMGNETHDAADSKWAVEEDTSRIIHLRKGQDGGDYIQHTHKNLDMEQLLRVTIRGWFDEDDAPEGFSSKPSNGQWASNNTWQHQAARIREASVRGLLGDNCNAWLYEDHGADREYKNCILKHINPKGWVDMYRQPKYIYWLTKAFYTDIPTVFVHPHFWRTEYIGEKKDIQIDANTEDIELFVNGKSYGVQYPSKQSFNTVTFKDVLVERGTLKAVGNIGTKKLEHKVTMPGQPFKLTLTTSHDQITADRSSVAIVTANIVDDAGNPVIDAQNILKWQVTGPATLVGPSLYKSDIMKHEEPQGTGYTVVPVSNVIRATNQAGKITVTVSSKGLQPATVMINAIPPQPKDSWLIQKALDDQNRSKVTRDTSFVRKSDAVPQFILPTRENHTFKEHENTDYEKIIENFIHDRNRGVYEDMIAFPVLIDVLANKLASSNGYLIADDYNFFIHQFNVLCVLEKAIDSALSDPAKADKLKKTYAVNVLEKGQQIDLEEEIEKL
ncbi:MAG: glycoside hydrolase family 2 TIM barrel-domain containing protein [candidate division KSB1 bacterium]|nr:glycoside hydrolase family 2 TIM barrel-domain containing protein [candidate division KSB1 bacterium]